ncbi:syntaxin-11b.1 isoform X2 [Amia ocellicauda]|uniref:syntaxin-11b.1 isoform X2 n=1 Tax=Amia ocellicauda TaxID=2972642 RepID=UPI0034647965
MISGTKSREESVVADGFDSTYIGMMRDRLEDLQEVVSTELPTLNQSSGNVDEGDLSQEAALFDTDRALQSVFKEAQDVRNEIQLIRQDIKRLKEQNARILTDVSRMTYIKRDSNAIAADIKTRGEGVLHRLQKMEEQCKELEVKYGVTSTVVRIARTQYVSLSNSFRDAMFEYNDTEMTLRENCKAHIQRQMEIVGKEVTGEEIEEMLENNKWNVFTENVLVEGKTARSALNEIECRHQELVDLENRIKSVHELFLDVAMIAEDQGPMMNTIEANIHKTDMSLGQVLTKLNAAKKYNSDNPLKKIFCGCFPCVK